MCRTLRVAAGTALIAAFSVLPAAAVEMQPGLWELTTKVDRNGAVSTRPLRSRCITAEAADAARTKTDRDFSAVVKATLRAPFNQDACKITDAKNSRDLMTWRLQCTGSRGADQQVTARFDNLRHYVLVIRTTMAVLDKTLTSVMTMEGQHKGECPR